MNNSDELADIETLQIISQRIAPSTRVSYYRRNDYSLITILWKFRIENPIFTPIFIFDIKLIYSRKISDFLSENLTK